MSKGIKINNIIKSIRPTIHIGKKHKCSYKQYKSDETLSNNLHKYLLTEYRFVVTDKYRENVGKFVADVDNIATTDEKVFLKNYQETIGTTLDGNVKLYCRPMSHILQASFVRACAVPLSMCFLTYGSDAVLDIMAMMGPGVFMYTLFRWMYVESTNNFTLSYKSKYEIFTNMYKKYKPKINSNNYDYDLD